MESFFDYGIRQRGGLVGWCHWRYESNGQYHWRHVSVPFIVQVMLNVQLLPVRSVILRGTVSPDIVGHFRNMTSTLRGSAKW